MHRYVVDESRMITRTTLLLTLRSANPSRSFDFQPGQYAAISFKRKHRPTAVRCFSIVSSPTDQNVLQFSMRTKGRYTRALTGLKKGDEVKVRGPFGGFVIDDSLSQPLTLMAGGIGITPFMSMIRHASSAQADVPMTLVFSCQDQNDVPFADELLRHEKTNPNFRVLFVIGEGPTNRFDGQRVVAGRITPDLIDKITNNKYKYRRFYICGPPGFMKVMTKTLHNKGVNDERIITEAFGQGPDRQTGKERDLPFNIYVLGALGVLVGSFVVMVSDLFKTLPPSSIVKQLEGGDNAVIANNRQSDLDSLVNGLPAAPSTAPASDAVTTGVITPQATAPTRSTTVQTNRSTTTQTPTQAQTVTPQPVTSASSDRRLKRSINKLALLEGGIQLYRFFYKNNPTQEYVGVMAQDIIHSHPEAVTTDAHGFYRVNYGALGINMYTIEQWEEITTLKNQMVSA